MRPELGINDKLGSVPVRSLQPIVVRECTPVDNIGHLAGSSDVDLSRDCVYIAEVNGRIVGILAKRLIPVVHTFELDSSPIARRVADALIHYGKGFTKASGFKEVTFYVEPGNVNMQAYIEGHGAVKEENADVYTMEIK